MNMVEFLCKQAHQIANGIFLPIACYKFFIWKLNREGKPHYEERQQCACLYTDLSPYVHQFCVREKENTIQIV